MSLELIEVGSALVGINTHMANKLVEEAIHGGKIAELEGYGSLRREVKYGQNSRIDFLLEDEARPPCYVEVKSVTLSRAKGLAEFPDSVSKRAAKHMDELAQMTKEGARSVVFFVVQRNDCTGFAPAIDIDPAYGLALGAARAEGVEMLVYECHMSPAGIAITGPIAEIT